MLLFEVLSAQISRACLAVRFTAKNGDPLVQIRYRLDKGLRAVYVQMISQKWQWLAFSMNHIWKFGKESLTF